MTSYYQYFGNDGVQAGDWSVVSNGASTLYAWVLRGGRASWDSLAPSGVAISYDPTTPNIEITLNPTLRDTGETIFDAAVAFSATDNPANAVFVAAWRGLDADQVTPRSLPATILLDDPELIKFEPGDISVADQSELQAVSPVIHGMVRTVSSEGGQAYRYNAEKTEWNLWKSASAYEFQPPKPAQDVDPLKTPVADYFFSQNRYPSESGDVPQYVEGDPSCPTVFWLVNDSIASWTAGNAIDLKNYIGQKVEFGNLLSGLVFCKILGLVNLADGSIDTTSATTPNVNQVFTWVSTNSFLFLLEAEVPVNYALAVQVYYQYFQDQLPYPSATLRSIPGNTGKFSTPIPGTDTLTDYRGNLKAVPDPQGITTTAGTAKVGIWHPSSFSPGEKIDPVNAYLTTIPDGSCQVILNAQARTFSAEPIGTAIDNDPNNPNRTEGYLCNLRLTPGNCQPSASVQLAQTTTGTVAVTVNHPAVVNPNYPVIGGATAIGNAPGLCCYLTISGTITRYDFPNDGTGSQELVIDGTGGTVVGSIPIGDFLNDLFVIPTPVIIEGGSSGSLPTGVAIDCVIQYKYESPNTDVSIIEHDGSGMLISQAKAQGTPEGWLGNYPNFVQLREIDSTNLLIDDWGKVVNNIPELATFTYNPASTSPDDNATIIKPNDKGAGDPGRFKIGSTSATDPNAVHVNVANEIAPIDAKVTPASGDFLIAEDSENGNAKASITLGSLPISTATQSALNGKLSTFQEDTAPAQGGDLDSKGFIYKISDTTPAIQGVMGYSLTEDGVFLGSTTTGSYDPNDGAVLLKPSQINLKGSLVQVDSLASSDKSIVYSTEEGYLYTVKPGDPGWSANTTDANDYTNLGAGSGPGSWIQLTGLSLNPVQDVLAGDVLQIDVNLQATNITTHNGSIEVGFGKNGAAPTSGTEESIGPSFAGVVITNIKTTSHGGLTTADTVDIFVRRFSGSNPAFEVQLLGSVRPHEFLLSVPGEGGGAAGPAFTSTTADFTVPAADGITTVAISVVNSEGINGTTPFNGKYLRVIGQPDATTLTAVNDGGADAPPPGSVISSGAIVGPSQLKGEQGIEGKGYKADSTTPLTIGTGSKVFGTTQAADTLAWSANAPIRAVDTADANNWLQGTVTSYSGQTLTISVNHTGGSGTIASWNFVPAAGINVALAAPNKETLTGTKTLNSGDPVDQFLDPGGATRSVVLPDPPTNGDAFNIQCIGSGSLEIKETAAGGVESTLQDLANETFYAECKYATDTWYIRSYTRS